jgi:uncharacterized phage protein gp47/JayE
LRRRAREARCARRATAGLWGVVESDGGRGEPRPDRVQRVGDLIGQGIDAGALVGGPQASSTGVTGRTGTIRDAIAFPKTAPGGDPLTGVPMTITGAQRMEARLDAPLPA